MQMELHSLARPSPPAVRPSSYQAADCYQSVARGLGTPALNHTHCCLSNKETGSFTGVLTQRILIKVGTITTGITAEF